MSKNEKNIKDGFSDIKKSDKTIWRADQFGKRVVEDLHSFIIKTQIKLMKVTTLYSLLRCSPRTQ